MSHHDTRVGIGVGEGETLGEIGHTFLTRMGDLYDSAERKTEGGRARFLLSDGMEITILQRVVNQEVYEYVCAVGPAVADENADEVDLIDRVGFTLTAEGVRRLRGPDEDRLFGQDIIETVKGKSINVPLNARAGVAETAFVWLGDMLAAGNLVPMPLMNMQHPPKEGQHVRVPVDKRSSGEYGRRPAG